MHLKDTSALLSSQRWRKTAEHFPVAEKLNHAGGISKYKTLEAKQSQSDSWLTMANGGKRHESLWQGLSSKVEDWSKDCKFLTNIVRTFYGKWKFWLLLASFGARFSLGIMPTVWVKLYTITINNNEKLSVVCVCVRDITGFSHANSPGPTHIFASLSPPWRHRVLSTILAQG